MDYFGQVKVLVSETPRAGFQFVYIISGNSKKKKKMQKPDHFSQHTIQLKLRRYILTYLVERKKLLFRRDTFQQALRKKIKKLHKNFNGKCQQILLFFYYSRWRENLTILRFYITKNNTNLNVFPRRHLLSLQLHHSSKFNLQVRNYIDNVLYLKLIPKVNIDLAAIAQFIF